MSAPYVPSCPACRINDHRMFYSSCAGCRARKAQLEAQRRTTAQPPTKDQVDGMDSTMQPLGKS